MYVTLKNYLINILLRDPYLWLRHCYRGRRYHGLNKDCLRAGLSIGARRACAAGAAEFRPTSRRRNPAARARACDLRVRASTCVRDEASSVSLRVSSGSPCSWRRERETNASPFFSLSSVRALRRPFCRDRLNMRRSFSPLAPACNSISARRGAIVAPLLCPPSAANGRAPLFSLSPSPPPPPRS